MVADAHLLASDAERAHVIELLQRAVGRGMLDLDEYGERVDTVLASRTWAQLHAVLRDLPALVPDEPLADDFPADPDEVLVLRSRLSEVVRRGRWRVPARIMVSSRLGSTRLDFTDAELPGVPVRIHLSVTGGLVDLVVPPSATVSIGELGRFAGRVADHRRWIDNGAGHPVFVLGGRLLAGEVRIRAPFYLRLGPVRLRLPAAWYRAFR